MATVPVLDFSTTRRFVNRVVVGSEVGDGDGESASSSSSSYSSKRAPDDGIVNGGGLMVGRTIAV